MSLSQIKVNNQVVTGVDSVPTRDSRNLIESNGVLDEIDETRKSDREFCLSLLNNGKACVYKDRFKFAHGYYSYINGEVILNEVDFHNVGVKIPAYGYNYLKSISLIGSLDDESLLIHNIFLETIEGHIYYGIMHSNSTWNVSVEKLKYIYINFFFAETDEYNYYFQFEFDTIDERISNFALPVSIDDSLSRNKDSVVKNNALYKELGVPIDVEGYLTPSGILVSTTAWHSTDYIPVVPGDIVRYKLFGQANSVALVAFYDKDKTFIGGVIPEDDSLIESEIEVPQSANYVRCCGTWSRYPEGNYDEYYVIINSLMSFKEKFNQLNNNINPIKNIKLFDSIKRPIVFNNKTTNVFGDSITVGVCSPNLQNGGQNSYINLFKTYAGCNINNYAISGSVIVPGQNGVTSIYETIISKTNEADIVMIAGGINDWQVQSPIGTFGDQTTDTLYGTLYLICQHFKTYYQNAVIIFITPIPTTHTTTFGNPHPDNLNLYRRAIQEVAMYNGFNVVNGADLGLPDSMTEYGNVMYDESDRVHPTLAGHALYARSLCGKLL